MAKLYFVRGGWVYGSLNDVGSEGYNWSRVSLSSERAYDLYLINNRIVPSDYNYRDDGFSLRCVAIGS